MDIERMARLDKALEQALKTGQLSSDIDDAGDRALLEKLIAIARKDMPGLDEPPLAEEWLCSGLSAALASDSGLEPGMIVGSFRLLKRIGSGGMGTVFLAERCEGGFEQRVALKVLSGNSSDPALFQLFQRERALLAQMEHPGIARLIDGGLVAQARPWFAMEYIDGEPIDCHAARRRLDIEARLGLFLQACDALDHVHRQLVLHRDVKPANLLVDAQGQVRLVDFGLGRVFDPDQFSVPRQTTIAAGRMTPEYASPEQARGEPVTVASEVYQLGLVLFRLLCGRLPHRSSTDNSYALAHALTHEAVARPSDCWRPDVVDASCSDEFALGPRQLRRRLRGDLDNIVLTALARDPTRRYGSVEALAEDLRRHLDMLPVRARAATRRYRLGRFVRRHSVAVGVGAAALLLLVGGVVSLALQSAELARERDRAVAAATRAQRLSDAMASMIRLSDVDQGANQLVTAGERLAQYRQHVSRELADEANARMRLLGILGEAMYNVKYWSLAGETLGEAVELARSVLGEHHPETRALTLKLAETLAFANRLEEAEALLRPVADPPNFGTNQRGIDTADALYLRGYLRTYHLPRDHPDWSPGYQDLEAALQGYQGIQPPPRDKIAQTLHVLGMKNPDSDKGLQQVLEALDLTEEDWGSGPVLAGRLAELALVHDGRGEYSKAVEVGERAYRMHAQIRGESHPETLTIQANLAGSQREAGRLEQAADLYHQVHRLRVQTLPEDHLLLAFTAHGLGNTLREMGDYEGSERWLREALRLCRIHDSGNEAITRENLARTLVDAGRLEEAIGQQMAAVERYRNDLGARSPSALEAMERLAQLRSGTSE
jgi:serine/threonine-protein kinase